MPLRLLCLAVVMFATAGCATWTTVEHSPQISGEVRPGQVYRIERHRAASVELRVTEVVGDTIRGTMRFRGDSALTVLRTDIRQISRFQARDGQSIGLIAGVLALGAAIAVGAAVGALPY